MICLLRHGESEFERGRYLGQLDAPLSARGVRQAERWAEALAGIEFSLIYASDLTRARRTASIVASGRRVIETAALREISLGEWDGHSMDEIRIRRPDQWRRRGEAPESFRPPGGESFGDLQQRVFPVFEEIFTRTDGDALIVSHAGVNRVILCRLLDMPLSRLFRIRQDPACLNLVTGTREKPEVAAVNLLASGQFHPKIKSIGHKDTKTRR